MKHHYKKSLVLASFAVGSLLFMDYSTGPGNGGLNRTGAPFDPGTCATCHSGGSFSASASIAVLDATNNPVTQYTPNAAYTVRITRSATGVPVTGGFGFQVTCASTTSPYANNNTWGLALPANTNKVTVNVSGTNRQYVEHTTKLSSAITQVNIPWTAPSTNVGSLRFNFALNTVNGNSSSSGDQVVSGSVTISPNPLPITWLYFDGKCVGKDVLLEWGSAHELNNDFYTLERSADGKTFETIATLDAAKSDVAETRYSFVDDHPISKAFYRISQTDLNGARSYYKVVEVQRDNNQPAGYHVLSASEITVFVARDAEAEGTLKLYSLDGKLIANQSVRLQKGVNSIEMSRPQTPGVYIIHLTAGSETIYHSKLAAF